MIKILIDKNEDLTEKTLGKILRRFTTKMQPQLAFYQGYYDGAGQRIMKRENADPTKPNNRIVKNYCATIADNFQGYLTGVPITYSAIGEQNIDELLDILKDNDVVNSDNEFLNNALISGIAYQLCYVNEKNEKRFKNIDAQCVVPIFANDLDEELLYCVYFYPIQK